MYVYDGSPEEDRDRVPARAAATAGIPRHRGDTFLFQSLRAFVWLSGTRTLIQITGLLLYKVAFHGLSFYFFNF